MKRSTKVYDTYIEQLISAEKQNSQQLFNENKLNNMNENLRAVHMIQQRLRERYRQDDAPIVAALKRMGLFQKINFIILNACACLIPFVFLGILANPGRFLEISFWTVIIGGITLVIHIIIDRYKTNERRNY